MKQESFYAGGFLYNPVKREVLLHKRDAQAPVNPDVWAFFGGLSEEDETPRQTFIREIHEELGIHLPEETIQPLCDYFNEELQTYRYVFFAESALEKSQMRLMEGAGFDWVALENVFSYDLTEKTKRDLQAFVKKYFTI